MRRPCSLNLKDFNNWVGNVYRPQESPANKELLSRVYPEWIEMQKEEIDKFHDMKKRIEAVKLKGPENIEDLWMLYRLQWPSAGGASQGEATFKASMETANVPKLDKDHTWGDTKNFWRGVWNTRRLTLQTQALADGVLSLRGNRQIPGQTEMRGMMPATYLTANLPMAQRPGFVKPEPE